MTESGFRTLRCAQAGVVAVEARTRHIFARHTHEQFGVGVIGQGAQRSSSGRGMVEAGAGDAITVNPGEVHDGAPIGEGGRSWRMLYFEPELVGRVVGDLSEGRDAAREFSRPVIGDQAVARRFLSLYAILTEGGAEAGSLHRDESLLLLFEAAMPGPSVRIGRPSAPRAVLIAKELIDDDPAAPVALSDLARESGLSRFQVIRGFAKAVGLTPHAYLLQRRVNLARRLIADGMPLAAAAAESGFSDQSHMTRIFVRSFGMSPGIFAGTAARPAR